MITIYELEDRPQFVVSNDGGWVPGLYPTPVHAAAAAVSMDIHGSPHAVGLQQMMAEWSAGDVGQADEPGPARTDPDSAGRHRTAPDEAAAADTLHCAYCEGPCPGIGQIQTT